MSSINRIQLYDDLTISLFRSRTGDRTDILIDTKVEKKCGYLFTPEKKTRKEKKEKKNEINYTGDFGTAGGG